MAQIKFKIGADSSQAQAAFKQTGAAARRAGAEGKAAVSQIQAAAKSMSLGARVKEWEDMAHAVRQLRKEEQALSRARARGVSAGAAASASGGGGSLAMGGALLSRAAAPLMALLSAYRLGGLTMDSARAADGVFRRRGELDAAFGAGEGARVWDALGNWGSQTGADPQKNAELVARLGRAGVDSGQAVELVKQASIAMRGDMDKAATMLESVTAAAAGEGLSARVLKQLEREGLDIRSGLAEVTGMSRDELDKAVSAHTVSMSEFYAAIAKLTGEGSAALAAFTEQQKSFTAATDRLTKSWGDLMEAIGSAVSGPMSSGFDKLGGVLRNVAAMVGGETDAQAFRRLGAPLDMPDGPLRGDFSALMEQGAETARVDAMQRDAAAAWAAGQEARQKEAESLLAARNRDGGISGRTPAEKMQSLRALTGGLDTREAIDAALQGGELGSALRAAGLQKRYSAAVAGLAEFGLTGNATEADMERVADSLTGDRRRYGAFADLVAELHQIGRLSGSEGGDLSSIRSAVTGLAADNPLTSDMVAQARNLLTARDAVDDINKALDDQRKKMEELTATSAQRVEMERLRAAGDEQGLRVLQQQAEAAKLAAEYERAGFDTATAQRMAADEVAGAGAAADAVAARAGGMGEATRSSVVGNSVAQMGGGGLLRVYDLSARAGQETSKNTSTISATAKDILTHLKNTAQTSTVAVLG